MRKRVEVYFEGLEHALLKAASVKYKRSMSDIVRSATVNHLRMLGFEIAIDPTLPNLMFATPRSPLPPQDVLSLIPEDIAVSTPEEAEKERLENEERRRKEDDDLINMISEAEKL